MKKYKEALDCFNKAIELDPNLPVSYYNKANTYKLMENFDQAIYELDKSIVQGLREQ